MSSVTVLKTHCYLCDSDFYELEDCELSECPVCQKLLSTGDCETMDSERVDITIDPLSGELYFG